MASSSSQPTTQSGLPSLVPHGRFKGKPAMPLGRPVTVIGGRSRSHLHLVSSSVSKSHAMVVNSGSGFYVRDLASRTHIFLNGQQVTEAVLKDGDILAVGPFTFRFTDPKRSSSSKSAPEVPAGVLRASNSALPLSLDSRVTIIGRRPTCDVVIDEMDVSTTHAVIFEMSGKRFIRDLGSRTGTFVNGTAVHQQPLEFGDEIKVGSVTMTYVETAEGAVGGVGAEPPDITEDLAGTAHLPAVEPLDGERREVARVDRLSPTPASDELDLDLEPSIGTNGEGAVAPADEAAEDMPLTPLEPAAAGDVAAESPEATESALGIELLPHDEAAPQSGEPSPPAPPARATAAESDFGLDFAEPAAPEVKSDKSPRWRRLFGREKAEAAEPPASAPAADVSDVAAADVAPPAEAVELTPDVAEAPEAPAEAAADVLELEPAKLDDVEVVEKTEPTPESALDLDEVLPAPADAGPQAGAAPEALTDSMFGREVEAFEGPGLGPIVVEPSAQEGAPAEPPSRAVAELDKELELAPAGEDVPASAGGDAVDVAADEDVDALIFEDVGPATGATPPGEDEPGVTSEAPAAEVEPPPVVAEAEAAEAPAKRRGGRKAAAPAKAGRKAAPKRKPPKAAEAFPAVAEDTAAAGASVPTVEEPLTPAAEAPVEGAGPVEPASAPTAEAQSPASVAIDVEATTPPAEAPDEAAAPAAAAENSPAVQLGVPLPMTDEAGRPVDVVLGSFEIGEKSGAVADVATPAEPAATGASATETVAETSPAEPLVFDEAAEPKDLSEGTAPAGETESPAPGKPADLFFGLERDTASFLGGMPLSLPPLPPGAAPQAPFAETAGDVGTGLADTAAAAEAPQADEPDLMPEIGGVGFEAAPAAPPMPVDVSARSGRPAPPPPARSGGRERKRDAAAPSSRRPTSPFDVNFEDLSAGSIEIPPFAGPGPATRGQVTTAFDGLAMPPVREADVFSQKSFGGDEPGETPVIPPYAGERASDDAATVDENFDDLDDEPLDLSTADDDVSSSAGLADDRGDGARVDGGEVPAEAGLTAGAATATEADADTDVAPAAAPEGRKSRPVTSPARRPPAYPTDAQPGRATPKKKRWRIGKWGLFGLMLGCMGAASGGIWYAWPRLFPNHAQLTASLRFENLEALTEAQRQQVLAEQRHKLELPEVRAAAREILAVNYAGVTPGFLSETGRDGDVKAAAVNYLKLTDSLKLLEKRPVMQIRYAARDGEDDRVRVLALLDALHAQNKPLIDRAGELKRAFEQKSAKLMLDTQLLKKDVMPRVESARSALGEQNAVIDKRAVVEALQAKEKELLAAWNETTTRVKDLKADVMASESAVPVDPDADPSKSAPTAAEDPQVVELARRVEELTAGLAAKRQQRSARADEARKVLAATLKQFEDDIANARGTMKPDSELGRYLDSAARVQSQLKVLSSELAAQQRSDMERLLMLKRKLAEKNETRIRNAFASDPELQALQETLALKERQVNAANGGGLRDDATALKKEIKGLKMEIESRQDLLTTADGIAPDMKVLEDFINETLARMDSDRARNDRNMAAMLKELAAQAPAAGSLPAEQKAFAEQLERRQAELNKARERYTAAADAAAAEADDEVKAIEGELAAMQAKVDERKKQVADAARKSLTEEQQRERTAETDVRRRDLDRAQKADQAAADAYWANRRTLNDASDELERLTKRAEGLGRQQGEALALERGIKALSAEVDRLRVQRDASVVPIAPTDDDVMLGAAGSDNRPAYMLGAIVALTLVFVPLMLLAPTHPGQDVSGFDGHGNGPGDAEVPYAAAASDPDEAALAAANVVENETQRRTREESPVTV